MSADINVLRNTLEEEYGVDAEVSGSDDIVLLNVTEETDITDMAKLVSTRGFDLTPVAPNEHKETVELPTDFRVSRN